MQVAKRRAGRPKTARFDGVPVRIDRTTYTRLKAAADDQGLSVAEFTTALLRVPVDRAFAAVVERIRKQSKGA